MRAPRRTSRMLSSASGLAAVLLVAACGGSADDAEPSPVASPVDAEPTVPATAPAEPASTDAAAGTDGEDDAPTELAPAEPAPTVATQVTQAAPPAPAVGGRAFAAEVSPASAFDTNPLPDLVVDDIGRDAKANVANIFPSSVPVLVWAWAPH